MARYSCPRAAAVPLKTGGEGKRCSARCSPVAASMTYNKPPWRPSKRRAGLSDRPRPVARRRTGDHRRRAWPGSAPEPAASMCCFGCRRSGEQQVAVAAGSKEDGRVQRAQGIEHPHVVYGTGVAYDQPRVLAAGRPRRAFEIAVLQQAAGTATPDGLCRLQVLVERQIAHPDRRPVADQMSGSEPIGSPQFCSKSPSL